MLTYEVRQHELNWDVLIWSDASGNKEIVGAVSFQGNNCAANAYEYAAWKNEGKTCKS